MLRKINFICIFLHFLFLSNLLIAGGEQTNFGIGIMGGLNRLEGDYDSPSFKPVVFGQLTYNLFEYLSVGFESGYSVVGDKDNSDIQTRIIPFEAHLKFSFFPLKKINPYTLLGGGGFYWNYTENNKTARDANNELLQGYDSFLKCGGGIEIALDRSNRFYFDLGATFRYSLTDMLDNNYSGDENDGLIDIHGGFTYYFRTSTRGDRDADGIPDELDIKPEVKEDPDGYLDHDGKPEGIPPVTVAIAVDSDDNSYEDNEPPVVIHSPIKRVEAGQNIKIFADIYENHKIKVASILYRPVGFDRWKVTKLRSKTGTLYEGIIPARDVKKQGLEYCVIAVDESISGVGYCGLPKLPVRVNVLGNPKTWRIISSAAAFIGWGTSGYLILRKQKF